MKKIFIIIVFLTGLSFTQLFAQSNVVKDYYPDGKLKSEITFSDSVWDGKAKFYYKNGNLKEERTYVNGKIEGTVKLYHKNGKAAEIFNIVNGKRDGEISLFDTNGVYSKDIEFTEGKLSLPEIKTGVTVTNDSSITSKTQELKQYSSREVPPSKLTVEEVENDSDYFINVDIKPKPIGGMAVIYKKLVYPQEARGKKIEGVVEVLTFIDENGNVVDTRLIKGIGYGCDEAAQTAIRNTRFDPGLIKGKPVKSQLKISIEFKSYNH